LPSDIGMAQVNIFHACEILQAMVRHLIDKSKKPKTRQQQQQQQKKTTTTTSQNKTKT
jgi:hypothetical protein